MIEIPKKRIERILKENGAKRVSKRAVESISKKIINELKILTKLSIRNARHFGRKMIKEQDVEFAFKQLRSPKNLE